jgi:hypothetical protein
MNLFEKANASKDKQSFWEFINILGNDFIHNQDEWESLRIDDFLETIGRWVEDYHGDDINFESPNWKTISAMFYMGKVYE